MTDPKQAAERLALAVWDVLADYHHDPALVTDEAMAAIRTRAFKFSRNVKSCDMWQVEYGRRLAAAVLVWANEPSPESLKPVERCSQAFEKRRISN
jgi:hypothetical protein